ncbi:MAG: hypothetical protein EHM39_13190 [Chloroflexi bacterium]|nr:MAG: hypothetical protein EHM39_13190 [Chloroflexota bacterium]
MMPFLHDIKRRLLLVGILMLGGLGFFALKPSDHPAGAFQGATPTPLMIQLPTNTPVPGSPTPTPSFTPTSEGRAMAEALSPDTNVRSNTTLDEASKIGLISPGTQYPILGKYFQWYQIEFPTSPDGTAWVHQSVIRISGDEALIPDLTVQEPATPDPAALAAGETAQAVTLTPGGLETLTAEANLANSTVDPNQPATLVPGAPLPTFTNPAFTSTPILLIQPDVAETASGGSGLPRILPILGLGALGLLGLLISFLRRM